MIGFPLLKPSGQARTGGRPPGAGRSTGNARRPSVPPSRGAAKRVFVFLIPQCFMCSRKRPERSHCRTPSAFGRLCRAAAVRRRAAAPARVPGRMLDAALIASTFGGEEVARGRRPGPVRPGRGRSGPGAGPSGGGQRPDRGEAAAEFSAAPRSPGPTWPRRGAALARTARAAGNTEEAAAARFVANRVDLYPAEDMGTQRDTRFSP